MCTDDNHRLPLLAQGLQRNDPVTANRVVVFFSRPG